MERLRHTEEFDTRLERVIPPKSVRVYFAGHRKPEDYLVMERRENTKQSKNPTFLVQKPGGKKESFGAGTVVRKKL